MDVLASDWLVHFSAHDPKAEVHYCDHTLYFVSPSSVVVYFSHFRHLLWPRWMEFNETWQEARSQRPLPSLCFSGRSGKQDGHPGLWWAETFSTSPQKLNGILNVLYEVCVLQIGKPRWSPWPLIGWGIFDFFSATAKQNSTKLYRKHDVNVLYQVCVFGPFGKPIWPPCSLIFWYISATA